MNIRSTILVLSMMLLSAPYALAQEMQAPAVEVAQEIAVDAAVEVAGPIEVGNKICPVSGEEVGTMGEAIKYEYNGKIYNLCCPMCKRDFSNDPEKYVKIVEEMIAKEAADVEVQGQEGSEVMAPDSQKE